MKTSRSSATRKKPLTASSAPAWTQSQLGRFWLSSRTTRNGDMATQVALVESRTLKLEPIETFPGMRALAWDGDVLYASRGYQLYLARMTAAEIRWRPVAEYRPEWWRNLACRAALSSRLLRDGFHALTVLPNGNIVAAVPGAIATLRSGETEFQVFHRVVRGTRPLHITAIPSGRVFWGEYFDNPARDEVHIYASDDDGSTWNVAHTFGKGSIRHVHNIVYDKWDDCLWVFTGDYQSECRILRASADCKEMDEVVGGNQQARAVAAIVTEGGIYYASDTPLERNYIYHLDRRGRITEVSTIPSSSIYGCETRNAIFFSTMVEPSQLNNSRRVTLFGSLAGEGWQPLADWHKDRWPKKLFQYGNAFLPDGENTSDMLAVSTIAVENADLQTSIWRTSVG